MKKYWAVVAVDTKEVEKHYVGCDCNPEEVLSVFNSKREAMDYLVHDECEVIAVNIIPIKKLK